MGRGNVTRTGHLSWRGGYLAGRDIGCRHGRCEKWGEQKYGE